MAQAIRKALASPALRRTIQTTWIALVIVFAGYYVWRNWVTFRSYNWQFDPWWVLVALVWAMLRKLLGGIRWVLIVLYHRKMRTWRDVFDHLRIYFLSNLANYIPGSVWYIVSRIQMSRDKELSTLRTSMGLVYETVLLIWSGCVMGAYVAVTVLPHNGLSITVLGTLLIVLSLLMIHPTVANFFLGYVLRILKRPPARVEITVGWGIQLWLVSVAVWVTGGLSLFYLLKAFYPVLSPVHLLYVMSASALAWTVGFLTPWAPSGLGVRDGLLVWLLEAYVPVPLPVVAAVASRMVTVFEDVSWAFIVLLWRR